MTALLVVAALLVFGALMHSMWRDRNRLWRAVDRTDEREERLRKVAKQKVEKPE